MTTNRKNTARQEVVRGPYAPTTAKSHLHLVDDKADAKEVATKKCSQCGREARGPNALCFQCIKNAEAVASGMDTFVCMNNCGAKTTMAFCVHCYTSGIDKATVSRKFRTEHPDDPRFQRDAGSKPVTETKPTEPVVATQPETPKTTVIDLDDRTLEYRELTGLEAIDVEYDATEDERRQRDEEERQAREARKAEEARVVARITARVAGIRSSAHLAFSQGGMEGLKVLHATIHEGVPVTVDGETYPNPHFKATIDGVLCDMHCTKRAEEIKKASKALADRVASERAERTLASAAASRRLTAQDIQGKSSGKSKKDAPKPGKSGGDSKAKGGKKGKK